jgi:hypothetical protein
MPYYEDAVICESTRFDDVQALVARNTKDFKKDNMRENKGSHPIFSEFALTFKRPLEISNNIFLSRSRTCRMV